MQGREIGALGDYKATAYIADVFHRLGLEPAGEKGTYFQDLPYGAFALQGAAPQLTVGKKTLSAGARWIPLAPSAASGTGAKAALRNVPVVFAGRFGDTVALDPARFRGKVAVFVGGPRVPESQGGTGRVPSCDSLPDRFGADAAIADDARNRARGVRTFGRRDERALAAGAAGVLFIEPIDASAAAAVMHPRVGMPVSDSLIAAPAGAVIDSVTAQQLFGKATSQLAVGDAGATVTANWRYTFNVSATPGRNVIAILPGSDPARAGEYVLISAHNDHVGDAPRRLSITTRCAPSTWSRGRRARTIPSAVPPPTQQHEIDSLIARARSIRPPRRDSIMNGADDDGSGTVILAGRSPRSSRARTRRARSSSSRTTAKKPGCSAPSGSPIIRRFRSTRSSRRINMDMEAKGHVGR